MSNHNFQIAIDGPVAAGKGTISRLAAEKLGFLYVDTGAMYRVAALLALRNNISFEDEKEIANIVDKTKIEMRNPTEKEKDGRLTTVLIDDEDVSWKIRTEKVSHGSSRVAVLPNVRHVLVKKQQEIAQGQNVIMEGRDITYRVLPKANLKIYLTANDTIRAKRRHLQLLTKGQNADYDEVYLDLVSRDKRDMNRKTDPLKIVSDAWIIDTSDIEIEKIVDLVSTRAQLMSEDSNEKR